MLLMMMLLINVIPYTLMITSLYLKMNTLVNFNGNSYLTEKIEYTTNITNNNTRHDHNNDEHNAIKEVNKHIQHINNHVTEMNYFTKKSVNTKSDYNLYHDTFNFRKNAIISNSKQTDITNNIIDTNTQITHYFDEHYLHNNKFATVIVNPTPSLNETYLWIPETSDDVVPGLDLVITYTQSKYATLTALQNAITNINNNIQTEINSLEIPTKGI